MWLHWPALAFGPRSPLLCSYRVPLCTIKVPNLGARNAPCPWRPRPAWVTYAPQGRPNTTSDLLHAPKWSTIFGQDSSSLNQPSFLHHAHTPAFSPSIHRSSRRRVTKSGTRRSISPPLMLDVQAVVSASRHSPTRPRYGVFLSISSPCPCRRSFPPICASLAIVAPKGTAMQITTRTRCSYMAHRRLTMCPAGDSCVTSTRPLETR